MSDVRQQKTEGAVKEYLTSTIIDVLFVFGLGISGSAVGRSAGCGCGDREVDRSRLFPLLHILQIGCEAILSSGAHYPR
jgi:hypothetical protein